MLSSDGRSENASFELSRLALELDEAYRRTEANLPRNAAVSIENKDGDVSLTLSGLDKLDEPPSLIELREQVRRRLPHLDLPEILLEIQAKTGFANEFTHISESKARVADLPISLCAVLLAEACNIGILPVVHL